MPRKKKAPERRERERVLEYSGWKKGDVCYAMFFGDNRATYCEVLEFHPDDSIAPSVSVRDSESGKYRVALVQAIGDTAKQAKKGFEGWKKSQEKAEVKKTKKRGKKK